MPSNNTEQLRIDVFEKFRRQMLQNEQSTLMPPNPQRVGQYYGVGNDVYYSSLDMSSFAVDQQTDVRGVRQNVEDSQTKIGTSVRCE